MEFEWDSAKDLANQRNHGVGFDLAASAFRDVFAIEYLDDRYDYGEHRYVLIAMASDGAVLYVAHAPRGGRFRIISARRATRDEEQRYYHENSHGI